jgi:hypothetical protein
MRPYLAVIADSFAAALSSRILWIAFVAIWLLLIALAPIGYREDFTAQFRPQDFHNGTRMKAMLAQGLVDDKTQSEPIGRIAAAMPDELRRQLRRVGEGDEVRIRLSVLAEALNELIEQESQWYDEQAWASTLRLRELRELDAVADGELPDSLRQRRARLRIEAAMPGVFETRSSRSVYLTYAGLDFPAELTVDKTQFATLINQWVLPTIINWLLGFILIFLGILVTASIVPDMLQPGSLHLLLSKPVSRSLLLIAKFIGGCAFVLLCVTQLVLGLYLIAGLRLDIWNARLLWCVPASVFLFSVFYSVSTLAGLRWRSPILAIGVTSIFGAICLVTGIIGGLFDGLVTRPDQIQHLAVAGDDIFGSTRGGGLVRLDRDANRWDEVFESNAMNQDRMLPPVAIDGQTIATARVQGGRFNPFGSGALELMVLGESFDWVPEPSLRLPTATTSLYLADDQLLALNTGELLATPIDAILKAAGRPGVSAAPQQDEASAEPESGGWLSKLSTMMGGVTSGFTPVLPPMVTMAPPRMLAIEPDGQWMMAMTRGRLIRLDAPTTDDARWQVTAETSLPGEASLRGTMAISGDVVLVARQEQPIQLFRAEVLDLIAEIPVDESWIPVSATRLKQSGTFALVAGDGRCQLIGPDGDASDYRITEVLSTTEIEGLCFDADNDRLYLSHHVDRVDVLDASTLKVIERIRPRLARWRWADAWIITPLRSIIPQTGELGETIAAMVSGQSAVEVNNNAEDPELVRYKIVRPIASCAIFIGVMLTLSCVYFSTRDF